MNISKKSLVLLIAVLLAILFTLSVEAAAPADIKAGTPSLAAIMARDDVVLDYGPSLTGSTGCLPASGITARGTRITGTDGKRPWAGVIRAEINGFQTPVFCIDLHHHISGGDCFYAAGTTSPEVTWILTNYPASFSLDNSEAAARQAAIWYYSDGWEISSPSSIRDRAFAIIASVPQPVSLPVNPPRLEINPSSVVKFLPDETVEFTVTATQDGQPATGLLIDVSSTFGTPSDAQVLTDASGEATFTLISDVQGSAEITVKARFSLPRGTQLIYAGTGQRQTLVIAEPITGYIYAKADAVWQQTTGTITAHKFADDNLNGVQDSGEASLQNWRMKLYRQVDGGWKFVESGKTDSLGNYSFNNLEPATYQVREVMKSGWQNTLPIEQTVVLSGGEGIIVNFGNVELAVIEAVKFDDENLDGQFQIWEPLLDGWRMTLWRQLPSGTWAHQGTGDTAGGIYTFSSLEPGTYRLEEMMQAGWLNSTARSQEFTLEAGGHKVVYFGNIQDICELNGPSVVAVGETATFVTRAGFASYKWIISGGELIQDNGTSIIWQAPMTPGDYAIEVYATTLGGAVQDCSVKVRVEFRPSLSVNDAVICRGDTATLVAKTDATNPSFLWSDGSTGSTLDVTDAGIYSVTVTDGVTGLTNAASGTVTVNEPPSVTVADAVTYAGGSAILTAVTDALDPEFLWSTGETTQSIWVSEAGIYTVTVTDRATGCSGTGSGELTVYEKPELTLESSDTEFCIPGGGTLVAETTAQQPTYLWSTGETTSNIYVTEPGVYSVTVVDLLTGWTETDKVKVIGYPTPVADFSSNEPVYVGQPIQFTNLSSVSDGATIEYWWDFGDGETSTEKNPSHVYAEAGTYDVLLVATREPGCSDEVVKPVTVDPLPTTTVFGYVFYDGTSQGIPGSLVNFSIQVGGRWIPSGSMVVGDDGYFCFSYTGLVQAIKLQETNAPGYFSVSAVPVSGGIALDEDLMLHEGIGEGRHGAYIFYDVVPGATPECGCVDYVVFHSNREGNWDLFRLIPGMEDPINLTNHPAVDRAPSVAPAGQIAFQSDRDGNWEIYRVDESGFNLTRLTDHPKDDTDPMWSPICEQHRLAFQSNRDGHWEIYVSDGEHNSEWRLTHSDGDSTHPFWSPDGEWIAFQSNRDGNWEVYMIEVETGQERRLTHNEATDVSPAWSPDSETISFLSDRDGNKEIYTVNANGGDPIRITESAGEERNVAWSPDGEWLAFQSNRDGQWNIYVSDRSGTAVHLVAESPAADQAPTWNCDATELIFQSDRSGDDNLYLVAPFVDGQAPEQLTDDPGRDIFPTWQPTEEDGSEEGLDSGQAFALILMR